MSIKHHSTVLSKPSQDSLTILLVDDHPDDVFLTVRALKKANMHNVIIRNHGRDALDFLRGRSDEDNDPDARFPDLILVDINMPVMNGLEMIEELKSDSGHKSIPVIVLSSSFNPKDHDACRALGVDAYLTKPCEANDFARVVESLAIPYYIKSHMTS